MGELADNIINGRMCSDCGIYFEKEHGFPVLCEDCHEDYMLDDESSKIPKATNNEL